MRTRGYLKQGVIFGAVSMLALSLGTGGAYGQVSDVAIDIGAKPLSQALLDFADQTDLPVMAPSELVRGKKAPAVQGRMSPQAALEVLLSGSGLTPVAEANGAYVIRVAEEVEPDQAALDRQLALVSSDGDARPSASVEVEEESSRELDTVTVLGSRIQGASDSGAIAVTVLTNEELAAFGESATGDLLANLPQAGSFEINESADGVNDVRGDVATVNLRGLGTGNTLILLNGRRLAAHGISQDVGSVPRSITNVNAFPSAAIDRVEVLRDGASALYGADATAGVVNTMLTPDLRRDRLTFRYDWLDNTDSNEITIDFAKGLEFNSGNTRAIVVGSYYTRDGLYATELGNQFNNVDKRGYLEEQGSPWSGSSDFRNTSSDSPFGTFEVISSFDPVTGLFEDENVDFDRAYAAANGISDRDLTSGGRFHAQPCGYDEDFRVAIAQTIDGCMGIGEDSLPTTLRFDFNSFNTLDSLGQGFGLSFLDGASARGRQVLSDADRYNFYSLVEHDFDNGIQGFGEVLYYRSETSAQRAASPFTVADGIVIPASNYWNPFGPVGSVNRLEGLEDGDVPDEGYDILIRNWRPLEAGPRTINTESTAYRLLGGLRGDWEGWDLESAVGFSSNSTTDKENRFSKTLLSEALALTTPDAINPFAPNANTFAQFDDLQITRRTDGSTFLWTADARVSRTDFASNWAGDIGAALGVDYRREGYEDNQDPRVDGTIRFGDIGTDVSDIVSQSPTSDSEAERNVLAVYGETLVPLIAPQADGLFSHELNLQLAVRGEYFDDLEDGVIAPKIALSYFPVRGLNFRAAYSEGFRAPNLVQLNRGDISRVNTGDVDYARENAIGEPEDTGDANMRSVRISNPDLEPENTETVVLGMTLNAKQWINTDWLDELSMYVDYWSFEQTGVIDTFGVQEALAVDFIRRLDGGSNPNVIRAAVTAEEQAAFDAYNAANPNAQVPAAGQVLYVNDVFINLDRQEAVGIDLGVTAKIDAGNWGEFSLNTEWSKLEKLDVYRNAELVAIAEDPRFDSGDFDSIQINQIKINGNPEWRGSASVLWRRDALGAGLSARYVSGFLDTSADNVDLNGDGEDDLFEVDSQLRVNGYVDYRIDLPMFGDDGRSRIRFGVNNMFDEAPPLADESLGFETSVHSIRGREFYVQIRAEF